MHINTQARAALTAMVDIAFVVPARPVSLREVSQRNDLSVSYLELLFGRLRLAGYVRSTRGPGGGYQIARPLNEITIADIVEAIDGGDEEETLRGKPGFGQDLWEEVNRQAMKYLTRVTLAEVVLAEQRRNKDAP